MATQTAEKPAQNLTWRFVRAGGMFARIFLSYLRMMAVHKVLRSRWERERMQAFDMRIHVANARRLHAGILRLRGVYIKVGQVISMLTSFLPDAFLDELEGLQDAVPPHPYDEIKIRVEEDLNAPIDEVFSEFRESPVASASLGQVHFAVLQDGREVAVKVQYPGIERIVDADLAMIGRVLKVLQWFFPHAHYERIHEDLSRIIHEELDYIHEGQNGEKIAANFKDNRHVAFPTVYWDKTTTHVLVMKREEGIKITDYKGLANAGVNPRLVIKVLVQAYFQQLLVDRFFHADPHPGNFFVRPPDTPGADPTVVFIDFGAVEEVTDNLREGMRKVVFGYMTRTDEEVINGMKTMGFQAVGGNEDVFNTSVKYYFDKILKMDIKDFSKIDVTQEFDALKDLQEMRVSFRELSRAFEYPRNWFYVERTLALLLGLCAYLDPRVNAFEWGFPYAVKFVFGDNAALAEKWVTPIRKQIEEAREVPIPEHLRARLGKTLGVDIPAARAQ